MKLKSLLTTLAAAVGLTTAAVGGTSTPVFLLNFRFDATANQPGWYNHFQSGGGQLGGASGITTNDIKFSTTSKGNFYERAKVTTDYATGAYTDIFGASHTSLMDEMKTSLGLSFDVGEDVYKTGLMNGGQNGNVATISGLNKDKKYVAYFGYGLYKSDGPSQQGGFTIATSGYGSVGKLEYVATVAGQNTKVATSYTTFNAGTAVKCGEQGLMLVRASNLVPKSDGTIVFTLSGDRSAMNFCAIAEMPEATVYTATVSSDKKWSEIVWSSTVENPATAELELTVQNGAVITLDNTDTYGSLKVAGNTTFKHDLTLADADYYAAFPGCKVRFPATKLADSLTTGEGTTISYATTASAKAGYTTSADANGSYLEASSNLKVPSLNVSFPGGNGSSDVAAHRLSDNSSYMNIDHGAYPVVGTKWNDVPAANNESGVSVTAIDAEGNASDASINVAVTNVKNPYDVQGRTIPDRLLYGYCDDGNSPQAKITGIPFSKYRIVVYFSCDTSGGANFGYSAISDGDNAAVNYCGSATGTAGGYTIKGTSAWGYNKDAPSLAESVNYIVSDVMTESTATIRNYKGSGRGGFAGFQIIDCSGDGRILPTDYTATVSDNAAFDSIQWTEGTFVSSTLNTATITVSGEATDDEVAISFDTPSVKLGKLTVKSARPVKLVSTDVLSNVAAADLSGVTGKLTLGTGCVKFAPSSMPSAGLRLEGTTALSTFPYVTSAFSSCLELACPISAISNDGKLVGNKTIIFDDGFSMTVDNFVLGNKSGVTQNYTQNGGTLTLTKSESATATTSSALVFGHWDSTVTYDLVGGTISVPNGQMILGWDGSATITVGGGETPALLSVKGIRKGQSNKNCSLTVKDNGTVEIGANGLYVDHSNKTLVLDGGTLKFTATQSPTMTTGISLTKASTILAAADTKLVLGMDVSGAYALTVGSATETGTVIFDGATPANVIVNGGVAVFSDRTKVPTVNAGSVGYVVTLNDLGTFTVPQGVDASTVKLFNAAGVEQTITKVEGQVITFEQNLYGNSCLMEYLFNKTLKSTGSDTGSLEFDGTHCFPGNEYVMEVKTNIVEEQKVVTTNYVGIYAASAPWRNVSFPSEVTVVMYGKVMKTDNTCQIGIGSTTGGSKYSLFLASGDVAAEEVKLCYAYENTSDSTEYPGVKKHGDLCTMSVPHAQTTDHLYAFTMKKVGDDTVVNIYLDGELLQPYTFKDQTVTLGSGIQLGSIHGGIGNSQEWPEGFGFKRSTSVETDATLKFLRVYNVVLNDTVMRQIAKDYPYASPSGSFNRELTGDCNWVETDAWNKVGEETKYAQPDAGSAVTLTPTAEDDVDLTVNIDADAAYETLTINTGSKVIFKAADEDSGIVNISGKTTISTDVELDYDAIRVNGAVSIATGKQVDIDLTSIDLKNYWVDTAVKVTGPVVVGDISQIKVATASDAEGRTCTFAYNPQTLQTELDVKVPTTDIIGTLDANGDITWTWGEGNTLSTTPDWLKVKATLVVPNGVSWTYDLGDMAITNIVVDGTATIGTTRGLTFAGSGKINVTLTDSEYGATEAQTLFTAADGATVKVGTVTYNGVDVTESCDIQGGSVTVTTKIPYTYNNGWTWNGVEVTAETVAANTAVPVIVKSDLEWNMDRAVFTVEGGTLKATAVPTTACAIKVESGATFDLNGKGDTNYAITLNGGELANTGDATFVTGFTVTANSSVNAASKLSIQSSAGGWDATTIELGTYTLTKKGEGQLCFVATTIKGAGTLDITAGTVYSSEALTFTDGTIKIGADCTYKQRGGRKTTVATIEGVEGAQLDVTTDKDGKGEFSAFTLKGTIKLIGEGVFATITMADGAVLNAGNKRGLTLAGAGTVNVVLTDDEIANRGEEITVFTPESGATTQIGTVVDKDGNDVSGKCSIKGGKITVKKHPAIIFVK